MQKMELFVPHHKDRSRVFVLSRSSSCLCFRSVKDDSVSARKNNALRVKVSWLRLSYLGDFTERI